MTDVAGAVVKEVRYDSFGNIVSDTRPTMSHIAFAGGLYDYETGLIRFGYRDYAAQIGRWTAKDPILFFGGLVDLFGIDNMITHFSDIIGLDVGVNYYSPGVGHISLGVDDGQPWGFYPAMPPLYFDAPGEMRPDNEPPTSTITIPATPSQDICVLNCIDGYKKSPPLYNLIGMQCTSAARNCLKSCKLPYGFPVIPLPTDWFNSLPKGPNLK